MSEIENQWYVDALVRWWDLNSHDTVMVLHGMFLGTPINSIAHGEIMFLLEVIMTKRGLA